MRKAIITGYPDYLVLENGQVFSIKNGHHKQLKTSLNRYGYERVGLCQNGKQKYFLVHNLVARAFLPNPENKPFINHKDENKANNNVNNLEWCTAKENNNYGTRLQRIAEANKKEVFQLDENGHIINRWKSQTDAGRALGLDKRNINACLKGKRSRCGGFKWRYVYD